MARVSSATNDNASGDPGLINGRGRVCAGRFWVAARGEDGQ